MPIGDRGIGVGWGGGGVAIFPLVLWKDIHMGYLLGTYYSAIQLIQGGGGVDIKKHTEEVQR